MSETRLACALTSAVLQTYLIHTCGVKKANDQQLAKLSCRMGLEAWTWANVYLGMHSWANCWRAPVNLSGHLSTTACIFKAWRALRTFWLASSVHCNPPACYRRILLSRTCRYAAPLMIEGLPLMLTATLGDNHAQVRTYNHAQVRTHNHAQVRTQNHTDGLPPFECGHKNV